MDKFTGSNEQKKKKKDKNNEKWVCEGCLLTQKGVKCNEQPLTYVNDQPEEEPEKDKIQEKKKCMTCKGWIYSTQGIFCSICMGEVHKKEGCSDMKRKQRDNISEGKVKWKCERCKGVIVNPYPKEDAKLCCQRSKEEYQRTQSYSMECGKYPIKKGGVC